MRPKAHRRFAVSLPWALLLIVATVVIMTGVTLGKARAVSDLENDFAQLQSKYTATQLECQELRASWPRHDASFICYYAAQNLGMKLALNRKLSNFPPLTRGRMQAARHGC